MTEFKTPSWSARNPLGIVALFISLIYGMSALLLGTSISSLAPANQTVLVAFVVIFPFVVLWVFGWLVARHHTKLYGPGDYRTDKGFLDARGTSPPGETGKRLKEEILKSEVDESKADNTQATNEHQAAIEKSKTSNDSLQRVPYLYAAESLVFQALQYEFGGAIRREVSIGKLAKVDGIIELSDGEYHIVEIKITSSATNLARRLREFRTQVEELSHNLRGEGIAPPKKFILAFVVDGNDGRVAEVRLTIDRFLRRLPENVDFRVYSLARLFSQYGLAREGEAP